MPITEARKRANNKYRAKLKKMTIEMQPDLYNSIQAAATAADMSMRAYVLDAVAARMEQDKRAGISQESTSLE